MAAIVWDATGEKYFQNGTDHGVLYTQKTDGSYNTGVGWNGLTGVTESPSGAEATNLWADNGKYAVMRSAEEFGFTISAYQSPVEFDACDGTLQIAKGVSATQQKRTAFGFTYRNYVGNDVDDQGAYQLHIVYGATASPSERDRETINDSPDALTLSWECTTTPVAVGGNFKATSHLIVDSRYADASKLAALEKKLYGDADTEPTLPLPAEIITLMGPSDATF